VSRFNQDRIETCVAQQSGGGVAISHSQFLAGAVAIGVNGRLGHAQFTGDLLGAEMPVHEAQAFQFALSQKLQSLHPILEAPLRNLPQ
jgi:hypothetical protein